MSPKNIKILIIEDDQILSEMYGLKFRNEGYEVIQTENGTKGIEIAKTEKPKIILLDVILPQIDGFSILKELKKDIGTRNIPVIFLTNLGQGSDKDKGKKLGAAGYLTKANITPAEVIGYVKNIVEHL